MLARLEGLEDELLGHVVAADQLDHDVHVRVGDQTARVRVELDLREIDPSIGVEVEIRDPHEPEREAQPLFDFRRVVPEHLDHARADRAEADQSDADAILVPAHLVLLVALADYGCASRKKRRMPRTA